jgi:hypothetical protein
MYDPYLNSVAGVGAPFANPFLAGIRPQPYGYRAPAPPPPGFLHPGMHAMQFNPAAIGYNLSQINPTIPGAPAMGARDQGLGLTAISFVNAGATTLATTGTPLTPFKGRRLLFAYTRTGGATGGVLSITKFMIGRSNQLVGNNGLPLDGFLGTSFGVDQSLAACSPAIPVDMEVTISAAPGAGDTVDIVGMILGETIGA